MQINDTAEVQMMVLWLTTCDWVLVGRWRQIWLSVKMRFNLKGTKLQIRLITFEWRHPSISYSMGMTGVCPAGRDDTSLD